MHTAVVVVLIHMYCCRLSRLAFMVAMGAQKGVRLLDAYDQQQVYFSSNSLSENTFVFCG
jgi:hypothetical protein